jgi:hypothetical protein
MHAAISAKFLGQIKLEQIYWTNLNNVLSNLIGCFVFYWEIIGNMVLRLSSFWNYMLVNLTRPSKLTNGRIYSTSTNLHPFCIAAVEMTMELVKLVLQIAHHNIDDDPIQYTKWVSHCRSRLYKRKMVLQGIKETWGWEEKFSKLRYRYSGP